jgi:hypothetical protein
MKSLQEFERSVYSQNGEDGILEALIQRIYETPYNKTYLEIGTESGIQCNTRYFREKYNWSGTLIDADYEDATINLHKFYVNRENIREILDSLNVSKKLELISIDIDSIDFYVLNEMLKAYSSDILVCEYNVGLGPTEDMVVEYSPSLRWDGTNYYGASLTSFTILCNLYDYSLIGTDSKGVNAFFVSNEILKSSNLKIDFINDVTKLYSRGRFGPGPHGGQPATKGNKQFTTAKNILNL